MSRLYNSLPSLPTFPNMANPFGSGGGPIQTANEARQAYNTNYNNVFGYENQRAAGIDQGYREILASQLDSQDLLSRGYVDLANQAQSYLNPMDAAGQELRSGYADIVGRPGGGQVRGYREGVTPQSIPGTGFAGLSQQVQGLLAGTNQSNLNDIDQRLQATTGRIMSQMIGSGLGNSTGLGSAQLAAALGAARERTASQNQFAQLQAGYLDRLGQAGLMAQERGLNAGVQQTNQLAGLRASYGTQIGRDALNFGERAYGANTALGQNQLNWQNSITAQYPDANLTNDLIRQQGFAIQAQQDREQSERLNKQLLAMGRQGTPQVGGGVSLGTGKPLPGPEGYYGSRPSFPQGAGGGFPSGGTQYAPDGTRLQVQAPATGTYGLGSYGGGALGGIGAASAPAYMGGAGATAAGAIGSGVGSYLDSLNIGDPQITGGPSPGNTNYFSPSYTMPLGNAPVADSYLPAEDWSSGFFGW